MTKVTNIPGRLHSVEQGNIVAGANEVYDDTKGKKQNVINSETDAELLRLEQSKQDNLTFDNAPTENSNNPVKSGGVYAADLALQQAIEAILLLIPSAATSLNQLADKAFVNSSISTATATFRGTYNVVTDLHLAVDATHAQIETALASVIATADNNDYCYVQIPVSSSSQDIQKTSRYKFNGTAWVFEYDLNTSGFTSAQWAAINSGITAALVTKLGALPTASELSEDLQGLSTAIQGILDLIPSAATSSNKLTDKTYVDGLIQAITALIPAEATDQNQLADKAYVLAQILAATPAFKGQFTTLADLEAVSSPKAGDIGIVRTIDNDGFAVFTFYQYLNEQWNVYYTLAHHLQNKPATTGTIGDYPYNGMGRVVLPMNIKEIGGITANYLEQSMMPTATGGNTIYVITHDYVLATDIAVPSGCVLDFEGGSVNGAQVTLNNTKVINPNFVNCTFTGSINNTVIELKGFGSATILNCINADYTKIICPDTVYTGNVTIAKDFVLENLHLEGMLTITSSEAQIIGSDIKGTVTNSTAISVESSCNLTIKDSKIWSGHIADYGIMRYQAGGNWFISNCEILGANRGGIYVVLALDSLEVCYCHIHDIGHSEIRSTDTGAYGIKVGTNGTEDSDTITNIYLNHIEDIFTPYLTGNDETECHGVIVYHKNAVIRDNVIEDLYGVQSSVKSVLSGCEHEGIYVKGDNPTITGNKLINACGTVNSDGAIAVKWVGIGGLIADNYIEHYGGDGIMSFLVGASIRNNIIILKDPRTLQEQGKSFARRVGINSCIFESQTVLDSLERPLTTYIQDNNVTIMPSGQGDGCLYLGSCVTNFFVSGNNFDSGEDGLTYAIRINVNKVTSELKDKFDRNVIHTIVNNKFVCAKRIEPITGTLENYLGSEYIKPSFIFNENTFEMIVAEDSGSSTAYFHNFTYSCNKFEFSRNTINYAFAVANAILRPNSDISIIESNVIKGTQIKYLVYNTGSSSSLRISKNEITVTSEFACLLNPAGQNIGKLFITDNFVMGYDYTALIDNQNASAETPSITELYVYGNEGQLYDFYRMNATIIDNTTKRLLDRGTTAQRPNVLGNKRAYFDTSLSPARPIWKNGNDWVDAAGNVV